MRYHELIDTLQNLTGNKPTQRELMRILGITAPTTMSGRASRNSKFTLEELKKIGNFYNVDLFNRVLKMSTNKDTIQVDFYPDVFGSCGTGVFVPSENKQKINIPKSVFISSYNKNKNYCVVNAEGNSMNPIIMNGDKVVIERAEFNTIEDDKIYLFAYNDKIYIKRLIMNINELVIKSDNPDKETYRTQYLKDDRINDIKILGKVVGLMRAC